MVEPCGGRARCRDAFVVVSRRSNGDADGPRSGSNRGRNFGAAAIRNCTTSDSGRLATGSFERCEWRDNVCGNSTNKQCELLCDAPDPAFDPEYCFCASPAFANEISKNGCLAAAAGKCRVADQRSRQ